MTEKIKDLVDHAKTAGEDPAEEGGVTEILLVWAGLMGLLILTLALHFLPLGPASLPIALAVAAAKMGLVLAFYMHLKYRPPLVWLFAAAAFVWLSILFGISLSDYLTRHWILISP